MSFIKREKEIPELIFAKVTSVNCCGPSNTNSQLSYQAPHILYPNILSHIFSIPWTKISSKHSSFTELQTICPTAPVQPQAASIFRLCVYPPDTSGHCSWVQQPRMHIQQQPLAPTWGSRMAGSHRLERGCNYHLQGLKLGEGHGRPGVQSLLWRRVSVAPCATGKVTVPTPSQLPLL